MIALGVIALVFTAMILAVKGERGMIEEILFSYVTEAEKLLGERKGILKKSMVIDWVHYSLPGWAKPFITAQWLGDAIERVLEAAEQEWASNKRLDLYIHS